MKKYIIIMAAIIFLLPAVFVFSSKYMRDGKNSGSKTSPESQAAINSTASGSEKKSCCTAQGKDEFSGKSVFLDESNWKDQNGDVIQLGKFKNKYVVMAMFFASCQSACPMIVNDMKEIEASISPEKLAEYKFVLVTIDPERDTPGVLLKYAKDKNLDQQRWTLLTGGKNDIMELAMLLGFKFSKEANGGFTHTNLITFLNKKGEIVYQNVGLSVDTNAISRLLASLN